MEVKEGLNIKRRLLIKAGAKNDFYDSVSKYLIEDFNIDELEEIFLSKKPKLGKIISSLSDRESAIRSFIRSSGITPDLKRIKFNQNGNVIFLDTLDKKINSMKGELNIDSRLISIKTYQRLGINSSDNEINDMIVSVSESLAGHHLDYDKFATAIVVEKIHQETEEDYLKVVDKLYHHYNNSEHKPLVSEKFYRIAVSNIVKINEALDYKRDYIFDFMGLKTFNKSYMKRDSKGILIERPQHVWMRVALAIHDDDIDAAINVYHDTSKHKYTHASPTLFNAGTNHPQMSSCFLLGGGINKPKDPKTLKDKVDKYLFTIGEWLANLDIRWLGFIVISAAFFPILTSLLTLLLIYLVYKFRQEEVKYYDEDSMESIGRLWGRCANISKYSGGIGLSLHHLRAQGKYINGTQGKASGLKMIHVLNQVCSYADQGGGKRPGAFAIYLEPWHADIEYFLNLKKPTNPQAARDLFYALWVPDLFMERVDKDEMWSLMCPNTCPGLENVYGEEFNKLYTKYEDEGKYEKQVPAKSIWNLMIEIQQGSGSPYVLYKDHINRKNNQKNLGTIKCSNLCAEIVEYSDPNEIAVCNLASISLPQFVTEDGIDYEGLCDTGYALCINLNKIIDRNFYPLPEMKRSNFRHRPIGIGIQGLHNVFMKLKIPFGSEEAMNIDREMMEAIYYGALSASADLALSEGTYQSFKGSFFSEGKFQFDLWEEKPSGRWDWDTLRKRVMETGTRNSLLTTCMPTASTSRFFGNVECFEPIMSNVFSHETSAGNFQVYNKHLMQDMIERGMWDEDMRNCLIENQGSVQNCDRLNEQDKAIYRTAWEITMKECIDHARARAPFVDQTMSMNLFLKKPNRNKQTKALFYAWNMGLKTGEYYFRTQPQSQGENYAVKLEKTAPVCSLDNPGCESCFG